MKKLKILSLFLSLIVLISGCSCDKFSMNTYTTAVRNYKNSLGFEYELTVKIIPNESNTYTLKESTNKYVLTTTGIVEQFFSELKQYSLSKDQYGVSTYASSPIYKLNRYYDSESGKFYTNTIIRDGGDQKSKETTTYETKYDETSEYNLNNLIPTFKEDEISDFTIEKEGTRKGYSIATFNAPHPFDKTSTATVKYKVTMDKDFYFSEISFVISDENKSEEYTYKFNAFNSSVQIEFPSDLANY